MFPSFGSYVQIHDMSSLQQPGSWTVKFIGSFRVVFDWAAILLFCVLVVVRMLS